MRIDFCFRKFRNFVWRNELENLNSVLICLDLNFIYMRISDVIWWWKIKSGVDSFVSNEFRYFFIRWIFCKYWFNFLKIIYLNISKILLSR